jgi:hypothetical protein
LLVHGFFDVGTKRADSNKGGNTNSNSERGKQQPVATAATVTPCHQDKPGPGRSRVRAIFSEIVH